MVAAGAGLSLNLDTRRAAVEAALAARAGLSGGSPSLAVVFASPHHAERAEALLDAVHEATGPEVVIGCVAEAVVGSGREVEGDPAVSVWLASFPGPVDTFPLEYLPDQEEFAGWPGPGAGRAHLLICDPFTFPTDALLRELDREASGTVFIGGMARAPPDPATPVYSSTTRSRAPGPWSPVSPRASTSGRSCRRDAGRSGRATR